MLVKTPAIVLFSVKYGDSGKILKMYTQSSGIRSFLVKSVYVKNNRKNALFSPLNQVEIIFDDKPRSTLHFFREVAPSFHYHTLHSFPPKAAIALFLAEILNAVLKEEEGNSALFRFIELSLQEFDQKDSAYADFHLWFLMNLTKYLGFYPNLKPGSNYFDLTNGISSEEILSEFYLSENELLAFEKLIQLNFENQTENQFNQTQRKSLISTLMKYFQLHISDFRHPKSLDVLNQVFE